MMWKIKCVICKKTKEKIRTEYYGRKVQGIMAEVSRIMEVRFLENAFLKHGVVVSTVEKDQGLIVETMGNEWHFETVK